MRNWRSVLTTGALALVTILPLTACEESAPETSSISIRLTDAPGDFEHAVVTISQIYLQGSAEGDDPDGRVILMDDPVTVDLLTLANTTAELVDEAVVPPGRYSQLRFVITGGYIEVENADGSTSIYATSPTYDGLPVGAEVDGALQMPSYAQSGLKVQLPGGSVELSGEHKILLVDFDVSRSFGRQAGASGMWVMTPHVVATEFTASASLAVRLSRDAAVTLPTVGGNAVTLADFKAVLRTGDTGGEELVFADADGDGTFEATYQYVVPGTYTLDIVGPEGMSFTTNPTEPASVTLGSGESATASFVITAASAP